MNPVRTLIVDDEPVARAHLRSLLNARDDIEIIGECGDGRSAVQRIRAESPDLVLLDVQMPELDGLGVVRAIGAERMPPVVFVTAYDQHALEAFEVHALDYILKPVNRVRFNRAIDRVVRLVHTDPASRSTAPLAQLVEELAGAAVGTRPVSDRLAVKVADRVLFLKLAEVDWVEAADDVVRIHSGKHVFEHRSTLSQLEQRLPANRFMRIHRSTIVNVERIREFQPWFQGDWILVLADGTRLQSGKSYRQRVRDLIER